MAAEVQFYLVWPWVERWLAPRWAMLVAGLIVAGGQITGLNILPIGICLGIILAHLAAGRNWRLEWPWVSTAAVAGLVGILNWANAPELVINLGMALLVASCIIPGRHWLSGFLNNPLIVHLGKVSYGIYLLHMLSYHLILVVWKPGNPVLAFLTTLTVASVLATISHRYFEKLFLAKRPSLDRLS